MRGRTLELEVMHDPVHLILILLLVRQVWEEHSFPVCSKSVLSVPFAYPTSTASPAARPTKCVSKGSLFRGCFSTGARHHHLCSAEMQRQAGDQDSFTVGEGGPGCALMEAVGMGSWR